jgi:hypothetical protein
MKVTQSQLLSFIGGSVIVAFAVNVASTTWRGNEWIWGSLGFLAALAIFLAPRTACFGATSMDKPDGCG